MRRIVLPLLLGALGAGVGGCSLHVRELLSTRRPCAKCDELLALCEGPRDWKTARAIRDLLDELGMDDRG